LSGAAAVLRATTFFGTAAFRGVAVCLVSAVFLGVAALPADSLALDAFGFSIETGSAGWGCFLVFDLPDCCFLAMTQFPFIPPSYRRVTAPTYRAGRNATFTLTTARLPSWIVLPAAARLP
jgi:hypothetical protein